MTQAHAQAELPKKRGNPNFAKHSTLSPEQKEENIEAWRKKVAVTRAKNKMAAKVKEVGDSTPIKIDGVLPNDPIAIAKAVEDAAQKVRAGEDPLITSKIGVRKMYTLYLHKQSNNDGNLPIRIPNHDGGKDWILARGVEHIVPDYVVNILKESVHIETNYNWDVRGIKVTESRDLVPRFSFEVRGEITV